MSAPTILYHMQNSWIVPLDPQISARTMNSCAKYGSGWSTNCAQHKIYTRQVIHYERGLHIHSSSHTLRTRTPYVYTRQVIHYERGLHMYTLVQSYITNEVSTCTHSSGHALRTRTPHTLVMSCITNEDSTCIHSSSHAWGYKAETSTSCIPGNFILHSEG